MAATFDYAAFIDELRTLVDRAKTFSVQDRNIGSDAFRRWRHELDELITRINRKRYDIACKIDSRSFQVMSYSSISARDQQTQFDRDFDDTIAELDLVIARYEKYGDPREKLSRQ